MTTILEANFWLTGSSAGEKITLLAIAQELYLAVILRGKNHASAAGNIFIRRLWVAHLTADAGPGLLSLIDDFEHKKMVF